MAKTYRHRLGMENGETEKKLEEMSDVPQAIVAVADSLLSLGISPIIFRKTKEAPFEIFIDRKHIEPVAVVLEGLNEQRLTIGGEGRELKWSVVLEGGYAKLLPWAGNQLIVLDEPLAGVMEVFARFIIAVVKISELITKKQA